ncbi:PREDICTED: uncharacterized protein LOC101305376 [Fragaria vesca subsp. vesca]|uniref:uncharacterized protein LOC101305376 n=1 Tax=Fragaria vesca subsp. vesca TaxID=101020 RepID=UPI0002C31279|nr:PREDICTED: uncharacterized protein LOC101305376 [Fragaria vesca subsp. vesca]
MMSMKSSTSTAAKKKKTTMMPRGFMCHSQAATAVCVSSADAARSDIISSGARNTRMINNNYNARYSKIVESRRFVNPADHGNKPVLLSSMIKREPTLNYHHHHHYSKPKMSLQKTPSVLPSADNVFQVVVMRVALHCQGCAGKVKKHLSKMEGVTSFSIDLETKMVTVRGHVSPVGVVESISKVKKAELLPSS